MRFEFDKWIPLVVYLQFWLSMSYSMSELKPSIMIGYDKERLGFEPGMSPGNWHFESDAGVDVDPKMCLSGRYYYSQG